MLIDCSASAMLLYAASDTLSGGAVDLLSYGRCTRMSARGGDQGSGTCMVSVTGGWSYVL